MPTEAEFFGGAFEVSISADYTLHPLQARFYVINATTGGLNVDLPDARTLSLGGPQFYVVSTNATNSIQLRDAAGGNVVSLAQDEIATLLLEDNSTQAGVWRFIKETAGSVPNPPTPDLIYMVGGNSTPSDLNSVYEYDPQLESWATVADTNDDRANSGMFKIGALGYITGGTSVSAREGTDEFDPPGTWTARSKTAVDVTRGCAAADQSTGLGYAAGGTQDFNHIQKYDPPGTDTWTQGADRSGDGGRSLAGQETGNLIHVFNGIDGVSTYDNDHDAYDPPVADTWTTKTPRPSPFVITQTVFRIESDSPSQDDVYAIGGTDSGSTRQDDVDKYDPSANTWTAKADYPESQSAMGGPEAEGKGFAIGGFNPIGSTPYDVTREYDSDVDVWTQKTDAPVGKNGVEGSTRAIQR